MKKVMNATINTFYDVTPIGKIIARFSQDLNVFEGGLMWSAVWSGCCLARGAVILLVIVRSNFFNIVPIIFVLYLYR